MEKQYFAKIYERIEKQYFAKLLVYIEAIFY